MNQMQVDCNSTSQPDYIESLAKDLAKQTDEIIGAEITAMIGDGWTIDEMRGRLKRVQVRGDTKETILLDGKPLVELWPISMETQIAYPSVGINITRDYRTFRKPIESIPQEICNITPPLSLWLQWDGDSEPDQFAPVHEQEVTWSRSKVFDGDVEYVHAGEIRRALMGHRKSELWGDNGLIAATMRCVEAIDRIEDLVTTDHESKEAFIQRVRRILGHKTSSQ